MEKKDNFGRTISIKMKTPDFQIISRSKTFNREVKKWTQFLTIVNELLKDNTNEFNALRLLGVSVSNLQREQTEGIQLELDLE